MDLYDVNYIKEFFLIPEKKSLNLHIRRTMPWEFKQEHSVMAIVEKYVVYTAKK